MDIKYFVAFDVRRGYVQIGSLSSEGVKSFKRPQDIYNPTMELEMH